MDDTLEALEEHRIPDGPVLEAHADKVKERWEEVTKELRPAKTTMGGIPLDITDTVVEEYEAANWIIDALWEIYDNEKYDSEDFAVSDIRVDMNQLADERKNLVNQYNALDPEQLQDSIKAAIYPIVLSVILPLTIWILHELGWVLSVDEPITVIEPLAVFGAWIIGFFWTLKFVWERVSSSDNDLPESPVAEEDLEPMKN